MYTYNLNNFSTVVMVFVQLLDEQTGLQVINCANYTSDFGECVEYVGDLPDIQLN